jgi:hypothetical protein
MILKQAGIIRQGKQTSSHLHAPDNRKKKREKAKKRSRFNREYTTTEDQKRIL